MIKVVQKQDLTHTLEIPDLGQYAQVRVNFFSAELLVTHPYFHMTIQD
jgi:hypothetical protein